MRTPFQLLWRSLCVALAKPFRRARLDGLGFWGKLMAQAAHRARVAPIADYFSDPRQRAGSTTAAISCLRLPLARSCLRA